LDAFLTMVAISEGTEAIGDRGYNVIVGSTPAHPILFESYADHPRRVIQLRPGLASSAAGRYQILAGIYDAYKARLHLQDFSPEAQDAIAVQLIRERGALPDIDAGRIPAAVERCSSIWASLPGNAYGQHQNALASLQSAFQSAGGILAA
jgi:muramidase (phage lysozyme)